MAAEGYPPGWVKLVLAVDTKTGEYHAIGGDREPGDGDRAYLGLEALKAKHGDQAAVRAESWRLRKALEACHEYFKACAETWPEKMERTPTGIPTVVDDERLDALCQKAADLVLKEIECLS